VVNTAHGTAAVWQSRRRAYVLLPLVVVLWGGNWPAMKVGLRYISPMWFATARMAFGAACMFAYLAWSGELAVPTRRDWPIVVSSALFQMAIFQTLVNFGLQHVAAGRSAVLAYTTPVWVVPGAVLFLGERLTRRKLAGLACGLLGVIVLFDPAALDWSNRAVVVGSLCLMLGAMSWSVAILHIRGHRWHLTPLQLTPWQMSLALVLLLPATVLLEGRGAIEWNGTVVALLLYNGPIATAFCFWAANYISSALPAITTSLSFLGVPAVGILLSLLSLGERPDTMLLIGFGFILAGVVLVNRAG
jgi:drug/metabolite transporter (DMT)-like permease